MQQEIKSPAYTPGPWATDIEVAAEIINKEGINSGRKNDHRIEGGCVYVDHGSGKGGEICFLRHDPADGLDLNDPEYIANAKLIAAAPELLQALQLCLLRDSTLKFNATVTAALEKAGSII